MIPKDKVDEIFNTLHIEEVIGEFVTLKKSGANFKGLSPFTNEKTPSFYVSPAKGIFKCFSSGKGGNAVSFLMEHESLTYPEALRWVANKYNIELPEEQPQTEEMQLEASERESILIVLQYAHEYFQKQLLDTEEGQNLGLSYFEERGYGRDIIEKFGLGYSMDTWAHLYETATQAGYQAEFLEKAGLCKKNEQGKVYDTFRGRVMFTIHNLTGKPVAFAGRILKKDAKAPKYVNSPETIVYHKSDLLYGLYFAKQAIRSEDNCYLVEGYTDVLTLHQGGVENVVASSGTSLTENQIRLIRRFTENITVLYDGDAAGLRASLRGIDMILQAGLNVRVVVFPEGEDPDSYCKELGGPAFKDYITEHSQDFILFKSGLLLEEAGRDPVKRSQVVRDIVESIAKVPDTIKRAHFVKECSQVLDVEEQVLLMELNKMLRQHLRDKEKAQIREERPSEPVLEQELEPLLETNPQEVAERDLVRLLLQYGNWQFAEEQTVATFLLDELKQDDITCYDPICAQIIDEYRDILDRDETVEDHHFFNHPEPEVNKMAATVASSNYTLSPSWETRFEVLLGEADKNYKADVLSTLNRLKLKKINQLLADNHEELKQAESDEQVMELQVVHQYLLNLRRDLTEGLGIVVVR